MAREFSAFYESQRFITVSTKARLWSSESSEHIHIPFKIDFNIIILPHMTKTPK
jgi:hypothetical protein